MSEPMAANPILNAALEYGEARRVQLIARRAWWGMRCEFRDEDTPACWVAADFDTWEPCDVCRKRQPLYGEWRAALTRQKKALRGLQRLLVRAEEGR